MTDLYSCAKQLVEMQIELMSLLRRSTGEGSAGTGYSTIPRYGTLTTDDTIWGYSRHGVGVRFINIRNLVCVDVDTDVDRPARFTVWRLVEFIRSAVGSDLADALEANGASLIADFAIEVDRGAGLYELRTQH